MENMQTTEPLNRLLRGELSAVETYNLALEKIRDSHVAFELRRIADEHLQAVGSLRQQIFESGGTPDDKSGAWGVFANTVEGTALLFGEAAALKALKEGEEHGLKEYESVLQDPNLVVGNKSFLTSKLRLRQEEHIATLDRCLATMH